MFYTHIFFFLVSFLVSVRRHICVDVADAIMLATSSVIDKDRHTLIVVSRELYIRAVVPQKSFYFTPTQASCLHIFSVHIFLRTFKIRLTVRPCFTDAYPPINSIEARGRTFIL